jgi:hypothetical protein
MGLELNGLACRKKVHVDCPDDLSAIQATLPIECVIHLDPHNGTIGPSVLLLHGKGVHVSGLHIVRMGDGHGGRRRHLIS